MNVLRFVGMVLATVGLIVLVIGSFSSYHLGLYLGILLILVGFVIYLVGVFKAEQ